MDKTNQNDTEKDPEYEAIKAKIPGLGDEPKAEEKTEIKPEESPKPEPKKEEKVPKKEPEPEAEKEEESVGDKPSRPVKYIPIKQYVDEKNKWKGTVEEKDKRIQALEAIVNGNEGSKKNADAIKAYADKYGVDEDSVKDLASLLRSNTDDSPKPPVDNKPTRSEEDQKIIDEAQELKAEKLFNQEYTSLAVPEIKSLFPDATPEQLEQAKQEVSVLACTEKYIDKSLDFIIYKEREALSKIFKGTPSRKGPEGKGFTPEKGEQNYSATDFAQGKVSFDVLFELPVSKQNEIIDKMDIKTYEKMSNWINQNDTLAINRGGRKVK